LHLDISHTLSAAGRRRRMRHTGMPGGDRIHCRILTWLQPCGSTKTKLRMAAHQSGPAYMARYSHNSRTEPPTQERPATTVHVNYLFTLQIDSVRPRAQEPAEQPFAHACQNPAVPCAIMSAYAVCLARPGRTAYG
jgi:hypothetical protein